MWQITIDIPCMFSQEIQWYLFTSVGFLCVMTTMGVWKIPGNHVGHQGPNFIWNELKECWAFSINNCPWSSAACTNDLSLLYEHVLGALDSFFHGNFEKIICNTHRSKVKVTRSKKRHFQDFLILVNKYQLFAYDVTSWRHMTSWDDIMMSYDVIAWRRDVTLCGRCSNTLVFFCRIISYQKEALLAPAFFYIRPSLSVEEAWG